MFDLVFEQHQAVVLAWLRGQTANRDTAADLLQETFVKVWKHVSRVRAIPEERRRFWVIAIAKNVLIDHRRREQARAKAPQTRPGVHAPSALDRLEVAQLNEAITELPEHLRTVLTMSVLGGLGSEEIGRILVCPPGTIRYRISEARKRLAVRMGL